MGVTRGVGPLLALGGFVAIVGACSGGAGASRPTPTVASSRESGVAFAYVRDAWAESSFGRAGAPGARVSLAELRAMLEQFLARFPKDDLVPVARAHLVFVLLEQGDFARAHAELSRVGDVRPGTASDLVTIARARWLRLHGRADVGLEKLRPLVGKVVDPTARALFQEELVLAAMANRVDYEAIAYMDTWLRASDEEDKDATRARVEALLSTMPREVLERSLLSMRARRAETGYGAEIERLIAARLGELALATGDAKLARLLLDRNAGTLPQGDDAAVALGELATSRRGMNVVEGRTIGLLLPTESSALRDESADVLRGVMWALGLPKGVRALLPTKEVSPPATIKGSPPRRGPTGDGTCGSHEPPAPVEEPTAEEGVRLVTRDDAGGQGKTEAALDELAGQGASVIIAALDGETADRALRWGESHHVPVITLATPLAEVPRSFGFVAGESLGDVLAALSRDVPALARSSVAAVVDTSELSLFPQQGGPLGPLRLIAPTSCDTLPTRAGDPRFPLDEWEKGGVHAWLVTGSPNCARDLVRELSGRTRGGTVALTLEAATDPGETSGLHVVSASAGSIPIRDGDHGTEVRQFLAAFGGRLSWWTALGRDAATLARFAVRNLPRDVATTSDDIERRRVLARDTLASVRVPLWTSEARGIGANHFVVRTVCTVTLAR